MIQQQKNSNEIERTRIHLLGMLVAGAASSGCSLTRRDERLERYMVRDDLFDYTTEKDGPVEINVRRSYRPETDKYTVSYSVITSRDPYESYDVKPGTELYDDLQNNLDLPEAEACNRGSSECMTFPSSSDYLLGVRPKS